MKTTRYRFEQVIQELKEDSSEWLIGELRAILESDKDFTRKCDYIGFSIANLDAKVASIDEEIKELQQLKKQLKSAKELALRIGAKVFSEYGIQKLEGAGISSITLTKPTTKLIQTLELLDPDQLIAMGYAKTLVDEQAVMNALNSVNSKSLLQNYAKLSIEEVTTPPKLKINKRRSKSVPLALKEIDESSETLIQMEEAS